MLLSLLPQIRTIRKKMVEIMAREASSCDLKELVAKFIPEAIGKDIEKSCQGIYPLQVRVVLTEVVYWLSQCIVVVLWQTCRVWSVLETVF